MSDDLAGRMVLMVEAVRADVLVGRNTCSTIDECLDDVELIELLQDSGCRTVRQAVRVARETEERQLARALDASSGEADCPAVSAWLRWKRDKRQNPIRV